MSPPGDCLSSAEVSRAACIPHTPDRSRRGAGAWAFAAADSNNIRISIRISLRNCLIDGLIGKIQFAAIGEDDLCARISRSGVSHWLAVLGRTKNDRDLISGLQCTARPAGAS